MRILLKFRGFIYQFEMFRSGGLAVLNALARREVYEGMGHADAVVSFSRIHRRKSPLVRDIQTFISSAIQPDQFH